MIKVYISGPLTYGGAADPTPNIAAFNAATDKLRSHGFDVINPVENIGDKDTPWAQWMRADLRLLITCDGIVMLPRWEQSKGASLENHIARELGMVVHTIDEFS